MKTKEEILKGCCGYRESDELESDNDITVGEALEAMEAYANQFKTAEPDDYELVDSDDDNCGCKGCDFSGANIKCGVYDNRSFKCTQNNDNQIYKRKDGK
jgi:hypothetical protein